MNITVAAYAFPNEVSNCFTNSLRNLHTLSTTKCLTDGLLIDVIRQLIGSEGNVTFIQSNGYGIFENGSWSGMMKDIAEGIADITLPTLIPTLDRVGQFRCIQPYIFDEHLHLVLNPAPKFTDVNILDSFDMQFWILLALLYFFIALFIVFIRLGAEVCQTTFLFIRESANVIFQVQFQAKSRVAWKNVSDRLMVIIWSVLFVRVLSTYQKSKLYQQMKAPISIPESLSDLSSYADSYELVLPKTAAYSKSILKEYPELKSHFKSRLKLKNLRDIERILASNKGVLTVALKTVADHLNENGDLIVKRMAWGLPMTSFVSNNMSKTLLNRLRLNARYNVEFGMVTKFERRHHLKEQHQRGMYEPIKTPSMVLLIQSIWKLFFASVVVLLMELLVA